METGPYSDQCPSAVDGADLLVIRDVNSACGMKWNQSQ